jgi:hypothetical protein
MGRFGQISLFEGESKKEFEDNKNWEIYIWKLARENNTPTVEWVIPQKEFAHLRGAMRQTFYSKELPFEITLMRFMRNATPRWLFPVWNRGFKGFCWKQWN